MEKMIMIPEWRYNKMLESYDRALEELKQIKEQLQVLKEGDYSGRKD